MKWTRKEQKILKMISVVGSGLLGYHIIRFASKAEPNIIRDFEIDMFIGFTFYWALPLVWKGMKWVFKRVF